jgi:alcohol dehydrogenase (cytochrome c)
MPRLVASAVFLAAAFAPLLAAQHATPDRIVLGRQIFEQNCTACHGQNAQGGRGPDLTGSLQHGSTDNEIIDNVTHGIAGTGMPAFPLSQADARALAAFLRSLRASASDLPVTGNAAHGESAFFGAAGCSGCHMYEGRGGRLGPDLTQERDARGVRELIALVSQPHKQLARGFETIDVMLRDGSHVRGVRKNEDTFSIQMMDREQRLHMLLKRNVARVDRPADSLMPVFKGDSAQVNDLVAFLKSAPHPMPPQPWKPAADFNVTFNRLRNSDEEPQNWLSYWGSLRGTHYSRLAGVTPSNIKSLAAAWTYQFGGGGVEVTPLVVDGIMFVTGPLDNVAALDARTGRSIWRYSRRLPSDVHSHCTVMTNRGVAILGDRLYLATLDSHLVALDAKTGNVIWDISVEDYKSGVSITHAPLAIDGRIIVGITAGECALTGFIDAYDAATGAKLWRIHTTPQANDPERSTWAGDSWKTGGGPTWMTGTYDTETDTIFWPTGNPSPDYDGSVRAGDNLWTCSILAIDPKSGKLKWFFQYTPHDTHDWDATETPVLIDAEINGRMRRLLIHADRNAFYYAIDRETGKFIAGKAFAKQNWAKGLDANGHPIVIPGTDPTPSGVYICPDASGATNWASPSYDPKTGLFFIAARESCAVYTSVTKEPRPGDPYVGSGQKEDASLAPGAIRAIDPATGDVRWSYDIYQGSSAAGVLATAGGVVFGSSRDGNLVALDAKTGKYLWHYQTGAEIRSSPISYSVDGVQYIAVSNDSGLMTWRLGNIE